MFVLLSVISSSQFGVYVHVYVCVLLFHMSCVPGTVYVPAASLVNHSCYPTCGVQFEKSNLCFYALQPIICGQEITQCYGNLSGIYVLFSSPLARSHARALSLSHTYIHTQHILFLMTRSEICEYYDI